MRAVRIGMILVGALLIIAIGGATIFFYYRAIKEIIFVITAGEETRVAEEDFSEAIKRTKEVFQLGGFQKSALKEILPKEKTEQPTTTTEEMTTTTEIVTTTQETTPETQEE